MIHAQLPDHLAVERQPSVDATSVLSLYVFLLIAVPSKLVFAPLGGAGTPAQIVGVGAALWYVWFRLQRSSTVLSGRQPVRAAMGIFASAVLISYVLAMVRPIAQSEVSCGRPGHHQPCRLVRVLVVANDGIVSIARFYVLLKRIAAMGGALASLGIAQFLTGQLIVDKIQIPGLTANQIFNGVAARDGFNRPSGTAVHPIEFGVVLTIILPIALVGAMVLKDRPAVRRWFPVAAIAIAIPLSISRTAIAGTIVVLAIMMPTWSRSARRITLAAIVAITTALFISVPGFLGTMTSLFTTIGTDSSAQSRTGAYSVAWEFIQRSPTFGRGFTTFLPSYWILDNQYLGLIIEVGFVGLVAMLWLITRGVTSAISARAAAQNEATRQTGQALAAAIVCGAVCGGLYDLLGFPMSAGLFFLVLGLAGGLWRLVRDGIPGGGTDAAINPLGRPTARK